MTCIFPHNRSFALIIAAGLILGGLVAGCSQGNAQPTRQAVSATPFIESTGQATLTATPFQPSPSPVPAAALVNGEILPLADFQADLARYQASSTAEPSDADAQAVMTELVDQFLLAQAAIQAGYQLDEVELKRRYDALITGLGSEAAVMEWMANNGYNEQAFRAALGRSVQAAWMRDQIIASVPTLAEQVHARQILLYNAEEAAVVLQRLQSGTDFASLAAEYDPVSGGELFWFPRGYLLYPELEQAAFNLQPGEFSQVVETTVGFHIVQVIEREAQRSLEPDALRALQRLAIQAWLAERRQQSVIEIMVP